MERVLLAPPVAFILYLLITFGLSYVSKCLAPKGEESESKMKAYACGEDMAENKAQPDYSQFFKFAFFFTIIHVIVLVVATDPGGLSITSAVYLGVTVLAVFMLLRR